MTINKLTVEEYNVLVQMLDMASKQIGLPLLVGEAGDVVKSGLYKLQGFVEVPEEEEVSADASEE